MVYLQFGLIAVIFILVLLVQVIIPHYYKDKPKQADKPLLVCIFLAGLLMIPMSVIGIINFFKLME